MLGTDVCSDGFVASLQTSEQVHQLLNTCGYLKGERVGGVWVFLGTVKVFSLFLKILTLEERSDKGIETQEERQGKMLLHTEYSLLSLLHNQEGVVHHHGLFQVWLVTLQDRGVPVIASARAASV